MVMQKIAVFKWSRGSRHTIGSAKGIDLWVPLNLPAKALEHERSNFTLISDLTAKIQFIHFAARIAKAIRLILSRTRHVGHKENTLKTHREVVTFALVQPSG
jgi:hypothetical protein